ncbi:hypothetical protein P22_1934 [Propionispora sp. 2/2-37]|uniref:hypothetical protein n=1 Tax=Propionispora sp. 2/2-37 TaxID=1677858 RepID=UPI0006BB6F39|nr:hypothetical protein [Propionispora sp. 2/2-37]CUH95849.1 hypothetical protein P22_1934 [Propionispora sp. 2/2-37]
MTKIFGLIDKKYIIAKAGLEMDKKILLEKMFNEFKADIKAEIEKLNTEITKLNKEMVNIKAEKEKMVNMLKEQQDRIYFESEEFKKLSPLDKCKAISRKRYSK